MSSWRRRSRSTPPFFISLSWQVMQYLLTSEFTGEATGKDRPGDWGGAAIELQATSRKGSQEGTEISLRIVPAPSRAIGIWLFTGKMILLKARGNKTNPLIP